MNKLEAEAVATKVVVVVVGMALVFLISNAIGEVMAKAIEEIDEAAKKDGAVKTE